jgi:phosphotransferase system HPr (HPr) family protein
MPSLTITIANPVGLHARPAALFVKTAKAFPCTITIQNLTSNKPRANAKSPLSVISQAVNQGHQILIEAEGESAADALAALQKLIESNFGEEEAPHASV